MRDVFVSHASEDKDTIVRPLVRELQSRGRSVWFDEYELVVGRSLTESISSGIRDAHAGVLILSPAFFAKRWTRYELQIFSARNVIEGGAVVLPVWHEVGARDVLRHAPGLVDLVAAETTEGIAPVADRIERALDLLRAERPAGAAVQEVEAARADALLVTVRDEFAAPSARRRTARELGRLRAAAAFDPLQRILGGDRDERVREAAADALGRFGDPTAGDALAKALNDRAGRVNFAAAIALFRLNDDRCLKPLIRMMRATNAGIREDVVRVLRDLRHPDALATLIAALEDPHGPVRHRAAEGLADLKDARGVEPLLAARDREKDANVWGGLNWALGQIPDGRAIPSTISILETEPIPERRQSAAYTLGLLGGEEAGRALVAALSDPVPEVRIEAAWALVENPVAGATAALEAARNDEDQRVVAAAEWARDILGSTP